MVNDIKLAKQQAEKFLQGKLDGVKIDWGFKTSDGFIYHYTDGKAVKPGQDSMTDPYIKVMFNSKIFFTSPTRDVEAFNTVRPERLVRFTK